MVDMRVASLERKLADTMAASKVVLTVASTGQNSVAWKAASTVLNMVDVKEPRMAAASVGATAVWTVDELALWWAV